MVGNSEVRLDPGAWDVKDDFGPTLRTGHSVSAKHLSTRDLLVRAIPLRYSLRELEGRTSGVDKFLKRLEPATRIERATCGLRNSQSPTSGNLAPQETTKQDASDMEPDGAGLSCPGSSVVADI